MTHLIIYILDSISRFIFLDEFPLQYTEAMHIPISKHSETNPHCPSPADHCCGLFVEHISVRSTSITTVQLVLIIEFGTSVCIL